ncbi:MAG TPA: DNA-processing protein DprA [Candidatus Saccharimonadales bacterium]|nr:DNA-processing protein DprA [Candidatus Saccharimonadales bacterium]
MKIKKITFDSEQFPQNLANTPGGPKALYVLGADLDKLLSRPAVAIVGSRKVSAYGKAMTTQLAAELARAGVVVVSGLAIGVDGIAHRAALEAGGLTIAVLPSGLDYIYPASHYQLARQILQQGGALVSEYPEGTKIAYKSNFVARSRIVSGISNAVLITEAAEKSGTLHTADFALQQGIEVLAVPGNVTSPTSKGTNNLIKAGATLVTSVDDIFQALGMELSQQKSRAPRGDNPAEQTLLDLLFAGTQAGEELLEASKLNIREYNQTLTMLEIRGTIRPLGNNRWALK